VAHRARDDLGAPLARERDPGRSEALDLGHERGDVEVAGCQDIVVARAVLCHVGETEAVRE
jgi:hypothetical protein